MSQNSNSKWIMVGAVIGLLIGTGAGYLILNPKIVSNRILVLELDSTIEDITEENKDLTEKNKDLTIIQSELQSQINILEYNYSDICSINALLRKDYDSIRDDLDELSTFMGTRVTGHWFSMDDDLFVSSEVITVVSTKSYTIRVTVTNRGSIGDEITSKGIVYDPETFNQFWIFVFPYKGSGSDTQILGVITETFNLREPLFPGESYSHEFKLISSEMTKYDVFVIAKWKK